MRGGLSTPRYDFNDFPHLFRSIDNFLPCSDDNLRKNVLQLTTLLIDGLREEPKEIVK